MKKNVFNRFNRVVMLPALLLAAAVLSAGPHPCLAAALAPLPQTGQTTCFDVSGNQLQSCSGTGQDGDTLAGVAWPASRFSLNSDSTITDTLTGLAWTSDANAPGPSACTPGVTKTWPDALQYVKCLNAASYLGHNDWRLPDIKELWSLFNAGQGTIATWLSNNKFSNVQIGRYKSSTASTGNLSGTPLVMNLGDGSIQGYYYNDPDHVWPVRTAQSAGAVRVPQTGETQCYDVTSSTFGSACAGTGQDGEQQLGAPWTTAARFSVATDTVDDSLTGLEWVRHGRTLNFATCTGGSLQWGTALQFVQCLNDNKYLNRNDWRLPNLNELSSLSNAGSDVFTWLTTPPIGFDLDQSLAYWSSSTYLQQEDYAWSVLIGQNGAQSKASKKGLGNVLPVRTLGAGPSGDMDGDGLVTVADALLALRVAVNPTLMDPKYLVNGDVAPLVNGVPHPDGIIDVSDALLILKKVVGLLSW